MKNVDPLDHSWIVKNLGATQPTVHKAKYVAALSKRTKIILASVAAVAAYVVVAVIANVTGHGWAFTVAVFYVLPTAAYLVLAHNVQRKVACCNVAAAEAENR